MCYYGNVMITTRWWLCVTMETLWQQRCILHLQQYSHRMNLLFFLSFGATAPQWARASSFTRFLDHIKQHTTVGRTTLDEWSSRRRDLYLTTHKIQQQISMPPFGIRTHNLSRRKAADLRLRPVFLNRRAAARYLALVSIIPGREMFSWNLSF